MKNKGGFIMKVAVPTIGGLLDEFFIHVKFLQFLRLMKMIPL